MSEVKRFIVDGTVINAPEGGGSTYLEGSNIDITNNTISAKGYTYEEEHNMFSIGSNSQATAEGAVAEGNETVADGNYSHVEGDWTLGILTEYDCELNDLGGSMWDHIVKCINPDSNLPGQTELRSACYGAGTHDNVTEYLLSITIETPNFYENYLDFHNAILIYNNIRYKIIEYDIDSLKLEVVSDSHVWTHHTSNTYRWNIDHRIPDGTQGDFVFLTHVILHLENNDNYAIELNGVLHGKGKIILTKNGLVTGNASHSEGGQNIITGTGSHAEGVNNKITGDYSHAEGMNNEISGNYSHAEGTNNIIYGVASHALGVGNVIYGDSATCIGTGLIAYENQTIIGRYNVPDTYNRYSFIVGNGASENNRSNAFYVYWDGGHN